MGRKKRNPNGYGTVVRLSKNRLKPFEIRVNTRIDDRGYPVYDILDRMDDARKADLALALYNDDKQKYIDEHPACLLAAKLTKKTLSENAPALRAPSALSKRLTFDQVYELFYKYKYEESLKKYSRSSEDCTKSAYGKCTKIHGRFYSELRTDDFRAVLNQEDKGNHLTHSMQEHIKNLFNQMDRYALERDIIEKSYSCFAKIEVEDDDEHGVPFTNKEIELLWKNKSYPYVDTVLIYIYSGWRVNELRLMPTKNIDLQKGTFLGGMKTAASKNRIVPIHSAIYDFVKARKNEGGDFLINLTGSKVSDPKYRKLFNDAIKSSGISTTHTPHDCRHTFSTLLDNAGANRIAKEAMMGHGKKGDMEKLYTHKDIEELRKNIELIEVPLIATSKTTSRLKPL